MPASHLPLAVGQLVRFIAPLNDDEREERFTVLELRGERVLVGFLCDMKIRPRPLTCPPVSGADGKTQQRRRPDPGRALGLYSTPT